jgi:hypothetical protein
VVVGGQTSFIISFSPTSKHQMSKRSTPITNEACILKKARIQCELATRRCEEATQRYEEIKAMVEDERDRKIALIMADLTEKQYQAIHKMQWSRIKPTYGIGEDEHGVEEFYVEIDVYDGYKLCESGYHFFKMADWAVHTNYPRNPFDDEDF